MNMIAPPFLKKGDLVAVIAPAKHANSDQLNAGIEALQARGLQVIAGNYLFNQHHQFAGTDSERLYDLQSALDNPDIKAVFCARGGYGTVRIIDQVDFSSFLKKPKWLIGFSDITYLHAAINQLGVQSLHGTMPVVFGQERDGTSLDALMNVLFGNEWELALKPHPMNRLGSVKGKLVGGNLTIIDQLLGTPTAFKMEGTILFIEEIDEYLYHFDRMMVHLKRAGVLKNLKGILVGYTTNMKEGTIPFGKTVEEIVMDHTHEYNFPIIFNGPFGHQEPNFPLVLGKIVELIAEKDRVILK